MAVGDYNGDKIDDLMIGAPGYGANATGAIYVLIGRQNGWNSTVIHLFDNYSDLKWVILRATGAFAVGSAVAAGDVNSDGFSDCIMVSL